MTRVLFRSCKQEFEHVQRRIGHLLFCCMRVLSTWINLEMVEKGAYSPRFL